MVELFAITLAWWLVGFSGAMMPGPISTLAITESARQGFWAGPRLTIGHALAELGMVLALAVGLSTVFQDNRVAGTIGLVGGVVLLWMGFDIARSAWLGRVSLGAIGATPNGVARLGLIPAGVILSISNPYWLLWWATVGATNLLVFGRFGAAGLVAFYVGHIMADLGWNSFLAFVVSSGRHLLHDGIYRAILVLCGAFLIALSFYFLVSGIQFWQK